MAQFIPGNAQELLKQLAQLEKNSEEACDRMLEAGADVAFKAVKARMPIHWKDTKLSFKVTKPKKGKRKGEKYIRVRFEGYDESQIDAKHPKGIPYDLKAAVYEYGKKNQPARPFLRPAMEAAENEISAAMQRAYDEEVKKIDT